MLYWLIRLRWFWSQVIWQECQGSLNSPRPAISWTSSLSSDIHSDLINIKISLLFVDAGCNDCYNSCCGNMKAILGSSISSVTEISPPRPEWNLYVFWNGCENRRLRLGWAGSWTLKYLTKVEKNISNSENESPMMHWWRKRHWSFMFVWHSVDMMRGGWYCWWWRLWWCPGCKSHEPSIATSIVRWDQFQSNTLYNIIW